MLQLCYDTKIDQVTYGIMQIIPKIYIALHDTTQTIGAFIKMTLVHSLLHHPTLCTQYNQEKTKGPELI
jgi:hypothetical protein